MLQRIIIFLFFIVGHVEITYATEVASVPPTTSAYFLTLSDIHFDPFINCAQKKPCPLIVKLRQAPINEWANLFETNQIDTIQYRQDSNYALLKSALSAAKHQVELTHAQFVLVLGDFLGHDFRRDFMYYSNDSSIVSYRMFVNKVLAFLTSELANTFPAVDVYTVVGNNDTYQNDYQSMPGGLFFTDTAKLWSSLIKTRLNREKMLNEFPKAGYYALTVEGQPNLRLIVLNTNLFSYHARGSQMARAADIELKWLHNELKSLKAKNQKGIIAMHIPQGIDVYVTRRLRLFRLLELWKSNYTKRFQDELKAFSSSITGIFAGHIHLDWFQILTFNDTKDEIVESGTPSISPIFGNNPGFKIYQFSPTSLQIQSYTSHYYPLNKSHIWSSLDSQLSLR